MVRQIPYLLYKYKKSTAVFEPANFTSIINLSGSFSLRCGLSHPSISTLNADSSLNLAPSINLRSLHICLRVGTYHKSSLFCSHQLHPDSQQFAEDLSISLHLEITSHIWTTDRMLVLHKQTLLCPY